MDSRRNPGRVAGFLYLLLVLDGPIRLIYIPNKVIVPGDAGATVANILAHQTLWTLGIVSDLYGAVVLILLVMALYRLFHGVSQYLAVLLAILGGMLPAAFDFFNVVNDGAALMLARGGDVFSAFSRPQQEALAMLFVRLHHQAILGAEVLWGLWLFPMGVLTYRSRFLPRFLGVWLLLGGCAYLVLSFTGFFFPQQQDTVFKLSQPAMFSELAIMLWLLIKGARPEAAAAARAAVPA